MTDALCRHPARLAAEAALAGRGFLRRDRGSALYVSDAPLRSGEAAGQALAAAGFCTETRGGLLRAWPEREWAERTRAWLDARFPIDELTRLADLRRGFAESEGERALFVAGLKLIEGGGDAGAFERVARQTFAVCLRKGAGGLLYVACACLNAVRRMDDGDCS